MRWLAVLAGVAALFLSTAPVLAAEDDAQAEARIADLGISVAIGFDGRVTDSGWQPVTVSLEPTRPVAATLAVSVKGNWGPVAETVAVEVAAGSRKLYRFLVPSGNVRVTVAEDGAEPLTVRGMGGGQTSEYLVGLMAPSVQGMPPLRGEVISRSGHWVSVDPAWAELSAFALEPLGTMVADIAALQALSPQGRMNLAAGVAAGTDLVVVSGGDVDLAALGLPWTMPDDAWRMTAGDLTGEQTAASDQVVATAFPAGYGRVVVTPVQPGEPGLGRDSELWSAIATPSPRTSSENVSDYKVARAPHQFSRLLAEKGRNAPALPWLGAFVAVYVLVIGPLNGVILARLGRRELAWATVPLITVIFTGGAFLGATAGRPPTGSSATLAYWNDGAAGEFVAAGVRAPTPGSRSIQLPGSDWTARGMVDGGRQSTVARGEHTTIAMELTALQLGGVAAWRGSQQPMPFEVEAVGAAEGVSVTIRNTSPRPLSDVVVRLATASRSVPDIAPGGQETVTIGGNVLPQATAYRDPFEGLAADINGVVGVPVSLRAVLNSELADGRPGMVWVSAVDSGAGVRVRSGAESVADHGAVLAVGEPVQPGQGLSPYAIQRDGFVAANGGYRPGPQAVEGAGEAFLRFRLPPGADATLLTDRLGRSNQTGGNPTVTVWDRVVRQWVPAQDILTDVQPRRVVSPLGEVWVRANGEMFPFEYSARTIAGGTS